MTPHLLTDPAPVPAPSRRRWIVPALAGVLLVSATAVTTWALTHNDESKPLAVVPIVATTAVAPVATAAATTAPPPTSAPADLSLGARFTAADGLADATALEYRQPVARDAPRPKAPKSEWGAAKVRVCSHGDISVSEDPWVLTYADGGVIEPSYIRWDEFPQPGYPEDSRNLPDGRCVSGWIVFAVLKGQRPAYVEYAPEDEPVPVRWKI